MGGKGVEGSVSALLEDVLDVEGVGAVGVDVLEAGGADVSQVVLFYVVAFVAVGCYGVP